jgi:hypothetical protein
VGGIATACGGEITASSERIAPITGGTSTLGQVEAGGVAMAGGGRGTSGSPAGASGPTGGSPHCFNASPCDGTVVGTWSVQSSCLTLSGQLDMTRLGIGCTFAPVQGGSLTVTGTWTARSDGTFEDNTITKGTIDFTLEAKCLQVSGTNTTCQGIPRALAVTGFTVTCADAADGGCNCSGSQTGQSGGMGVPLVFPSTVGDYTTSGNTLTASLGGPYSTPYSYCVSGNTLTMTPQPTGGPTYAGTIVLERQ